ncbi:MAG: extracellular solute-binding protein [Nitrospirae bacterium]|nr:MAG: extracellular solute-binding protein [Nitrospirota bacterium]
MVRIMIKEYRGGSSTGETSTPVLMTFICSFLILFISFLSGCKSGERSVVVYVSVDQVYAEPILKAFEKETGIRVRAVYDVEAAKTTGLTTRLIAEKDHPRADVFWNNEFAQTLRLKEQGVLASFRPASASELPETFRDPSGFWFGLGGRARIFLVNRNLLKPADYPKKLEDFLNPKYPPDRIGMALPLFGTTATHAAALYAAMKAGPARDLFSAVKARGIRIVDGNAVVRDMVVGGHWMFGLTDTDDALGAIERGAPVDVIAPDQDGRGTLVIPGTVAFIRGAPHRQEAGELINYLLRAETENKLILSGACQWSLRGDLKSVAMFPTGLKTMSVTLQDVHKQLPLAMVQMREIFSR